MSMTTENVEENTVSRANITAIQVYAAPFRVSHVLHIRCKIYRVKAEANNYLIIPTS